jgi:ParB family chromosome partitioning protein
LGRGLGALIPQAELHDSGPGALQEIPAADIVANPNQPRTRFDEEAITALADSIRELGVLQPLIVRHADGGGYTLVAGERRLRAARRIGLQTVPAIVRDTDDAMSLAHAIVENVQREDLNALEEATAYQQLIEEFGLTHEQVASRVGKSRAAVTNFVRLLQLAPSIQVLVRDGRLQMGHARALLGTPDREYQETLARRAVADEMSVRAVEEAVREHEHRDDEPLPGATPAGAAPHAVQPLRQAGLIELEELLSDHLDTRVRVSMTNRRGKVVLEFANLEDLERIYRLMTEGRPTGP